MRPSELKREVKERGEDSHFFTRESMKFWGDTMANYRVRSATVDTRDGPIECWELYRRRPVKHGVDGSAFFAKDSLRQVFSEELE